MDQHKESSEIMIYDYVKEIERKLLLLVQEGVSSMYISAAEAVQIARDFLELLPITRCGELCDKLLYLSTIHTVCRTLYLEYAKPYDEVTRRKKVSVIEELLRENAINRAYFLTKGGIL